MCCEQNTDDGDVTTISPFKGEQTGALHGFHWLLTHVSFDVATPYRWNVIAPDGVTKGGEAATEQAARDAAEEWIDQRNADALFYAAMSRPRITEQEQPDRYDDRDPNDQEQWR